METANYNLVQKYKWQRPVLGAGLGHHKVQSTWREEFGATCPSEVQESEAMHDDDDMAFGDDETETAVEQDKKPQ